MEKTFRALNRFFIFTGMLSFIFIFTVTPAMTQTITEKLPSGTDEYDITGKVEGVAFKKGITKIQDFKDGYYLAVKNKNGKYEYLVMKGMTTYSPISNKSVQTTNEPIVISVGFCTVTVYKSTATRPKVTTGNSKITATVKCN